MLDLLPSLNTGTTLETLNASGKIPLIRGDRGNGDHWGNGSRSKTKKCVNVYEFEYVLPSVHC